MLAFITGTGFYDLPGLEDRRVVAVVSPYGEVAVVRGTWAGADVAFLPRHGTGHSVAPHRINYRANVWALHEVGAAGVLATAVSGGIDPEMRPGDLVLIDQFIDVTSGRPGTFFDTEGEVHHTDVTQPYDVGLRSRLARSAAAEGVDVHPDGTYICTNGPRFETPAEIAAYRTWGADLVGMTGCPEVALANELSLPYASVGVVSNPAAGMSDGPITGEQIMATIASAAERLLTVFTHALTHP